MIPAGTGFVVSVALQDLSISFGTLSFDETTASGVNFAFANGLLVDFTLAGNLNFLASGAGTDDFAVWTDGGFAYSTVGTPTMIYVTDTSALSFSLVSTAVPEPATIALFGAGLAGLGWIRRRWKAV